ncbi:MAG: hypothetical protein RBR78_06920, partial [Flavobacteriaceae bacterium]|nr:hypothetical protein [Flavobacteriaceae bacterium]
MIILIIISGSGLLAQCPEVTNTTQSFCDIQSPTISDLQAIDNGGGVAWFATEDSLTPLNSGQGLINGEDYFADNASGDCGNRTRVVVTIFTAPIGQNFQGVCVDNPNDATISSLIAIGNNVQWYNVLIGGTPLDPSTVLVPYTIYYASQTNPNTGCETSRLSVFVTMGVVPVPTGDTLQIFCQNPSNPPTVGDLSASGNNNWYLTSSSALPLDINTPLIDGHTYYATTVDPPCESLDRLEVTVSIQQFNDAGNDGTINLCFEGIETVPPVNLFDYLGGTPFDTGSWSGPLSTTNGFIGTTDVSTLTVENSPYIFTYTVDSSTECPPDSATVTIIISYPPNSGEDSSVTLCETDAPINLFDYLNGTPDTGGVWTPALPTDGIFDPATDSGGVYTYTIEDSVCGNQTATLTVTVNQIPNPGEDSSVTLCETDAPINLFDYLNGTPDTGGVWTPTLPTDGIFDPATDTAGTFTYTIEDSVCGNQSATLTVSVTQPQNPGEDSSVTLCETDAPINLFDYLNGTPDTGGVWTPTLPTDGIFDPATDSGGVYTYTIEDSVCGNQTATLTVTVNQIPNPGEDSSVTLCETD